MAVRPRSEMVELFFLLITCILLTIDIFFNITSIRKFKNINISDYLNDTLHNHPQQLQEFQRLLNEVVEVAAAAAASTSD
jgi:biotin synthase-related radical SAM superfamily protein